MGAELTTGTGIKLIQQADFVDSEPTISGGQDIPFLDESLSGEFDALEVRHSQDRMNHEAAGGNLGRQEVGGDFTTFVDNDTVGYLLYGLFGGVSKTADDPEAGYQTHTFTPNDTLDHYEVAAQFGTHDDVKHVWNALFDSASFDFTDEMLQATWTMAGANINDSNQDGPLTYTFPSGDWFHFRHATAKINPEGGSEVEVPIRSATFDIENGVITDDFVLGSTTLDSIVAGEFSASGTMELRFAPDDNSALQSWFQGDESATVTMEYDRAQDNASDHQELHITFRNVYVSSNEIAMATQEMIDRSLDFEAYEGSNDAAEAVLINDQDADYSST